MAKYADIIRELAYNTDSFFKLARAAAEDKADKIDDYVGKVTQTAVRVSEALKPVSTKYEPETPARSEGDES